MKKLSFILLGGFMVFQACTDTSTKVETSKDSLSNKDAQVVIQAPDTAMKSGTTTSTTDAQSTQFAMKAANGGMMEVDLGRWAQDHSTNSSVKQYGAMMVADHSKANDELKGIASSKSISLPGMVEGNEKMEMDELMKKKGNDFDKAYVNMMVEDHDKDVAEFEKAANELPDADLKNFAARTLPVLKKHQAAIRSIKSKMK